MKRYLFSILIICIVTIAFNGCKGKADSSVAQDSTANEVPQFNADSAFADIVAQCNFGPRTMESEAHEKCGDYIISKFRQYGLTVSKQEASFTLYNGQTVKGYNIIVQINPKATERILIASHWDSRPWADNDSDPNNHKKPVMAANDGASGVAVMIEMARLLKDSSLNKGIDFVCFDAEDVGVPQWETKVQDNEDFWCLGAQYWAKAPKASGYEFGILLDMVGGQGAHFNRESNSTRYASNVVDKVWSAAKQAGYGTFFPDEDGGSITDDHLPVNRIAKIPMIDIVPYYPGENAFGPTWHTAQDTPQNIDKNTLKAVGQTLLQLICNL